MDRNAPIDSAGAFAELGRATLHRGRFIDLDEITWRGPDGKARRWESAERAGGRGAVMIIAWLQPSDRLLLVRQYRPPARGMVLEFPAGLVEAGEDPADAARRELLEETGYHGEVARVTPPAFSSPGLSSEAVATAWMTVDETRPENVQARARPDDGEFVTTLTVARADAAAFDAAERAQGALFDAKVALYLSLLADASAISPG